MFEVKIFTYYKKVPSNDDNVTIIKYRNYLLTKNYALCLIVKKLF